MKVSVKTHLAQESYILCRLLLFTPEEIVQYYVDQVSINTMLNGHQPEYNIATHFFIKYAANQKRENMQLTQQALKQINKPATRRRLMDVLGVTEFTIARYIQKNSDNLTKAAAMQVIREVTGLPDDKILEEKTARNKKR